MEGEIDWKARAEKAEAELAKIKSHVRCMYCNAEYAYADSDKLADHIMACEKSPLVQANQEIQSKAIDLLDMTKDEFVRIAAISDNTEIQGICARSQEMIDQKYPVIKQRDEAIARAEKAEAACAEMRAALEMCAAVVRNEIAVCEIVGKSAKIWPDVLTGCCSGGGIEHALSTDCGSNYVPKAELDAAKEFAAELMRRWASNRNDYDGFHLRCEEAKRLGIKWENIP